MEVTQNFMDEMKSMMKVLIDRSQVQGAQIEGLTKAMAEVKEDINILKDEICGVKGEINGIKGEINGIKDEINSIKEDIADIRATMATKDDIKIIHEQLAEIKSDQAYLKNQTHRNTIDIYHLKLQMGKLINPE